MIIIADAGSTKTEWAVLSVDRHIELQFSTSGHNAAVAAEGSLRQLIRTEATILISLADDIREIHYYGAGCAGEHCRKIRAELSELFPGAECHVESDMLASARALCGHEPGIACILGTGSNSCLFDGERIVANVSPLGFIIGDEGSGAVLGRRLIAHIFKRQFSDEVIKLFSDEYPDTDIPEIIRRVYRSERPNTYLASFAPFLSRHIDIEEIDSFVTDEFERFFRFNVMAYDDAHRLPVNFIGSIAVSFRPQLHAAATRCNLRLGNITRTPMPSLIAYHG